MLNTQIENTKHERTNRNTIVISHVQLFCVVVSILHEKEVAIKTFINLVILYSVSESHQINAWNISLS